MPRRRMLPNRPTIAVRAVTATICAAATVAALVVMAPPARASAASAFVADTNRARSSNGLAALSVSSDLTAVAQRQAADMAAKGSLYHNASLGSDVCCWSSLGENIGEGQSESQLQSAFMNSAPHRENILSSAYTQIGVGTATDSNGTLWVDEVFRQPTGSNGSRRISTAQRTTTKSPVHSSAPSRPRVVARRPQARPTLLALFLRRLRQVATRRGRPRDPVAAAYGFATVMTQLQR